MCDGAERASVVLDERSEQEPSEPDPGADAERVEFGVTSGEDLVEGLPDAAEASPDVKRTFWVSVLLVKVAVFAITLGLLTAYFWGWTTRGGLLVLGGSLAIVDVYVRVRRFKRRQSTSTDDE